VGLIMGVPMPLKPRLFSPCRMPRQRTLNGPPFAAVSPLKVDVDTVLHVPRLRRVLADYDPADKVLLCNKPITNIPSWYKRLSEGGGQGEGNDDRSNEGGSGTSSGGSGSNRPSAPRTRTPSPSGARPEPLTGGLPATCLDGPLEVVSAAAASAYLGVEYTGRATGGDTRWGAQGTEGRAAGGPGPAAPPHSPLPPPQGVGWRRCYPESSDDGAAAAGASLPSSVAAVASAALTSVKAMGKPKPKVQGSHGTYGSGVVAAPKTLLPQLAPELVDQVKRESALA